MPSYKQAKYTAAQTQEIMMRTLGVLSDNIVPLTIDEICQQDTCLVGMTSQKMARVLTELCEAGFAKKMKSKSKGRMVYANINVSFE